MKGIIRKFRKWIKYKFSTYYPDPCDFTIYESYDTPIENKEGESIISLGDSQSGHLSDIQQIRNLYVEDYVARVYDRVVNGIRNSKGVSILISPNQNSATDAEKYLHKLFYANKEDPSITLEKLKNQFDKVFGAVDNDYIPPPPPPPPIRTISESDFRFNEAFKKAAGKKSKPKPPLDRSLKEGKQPTKPEFITDLDNSTSITMDIDSVFV